MLEKPERKKVAAFFLLEDDVSDVFPNEEVGVVGSLVPLQLARHVVADVAAVDFQVFEEQVAHAVLLVVAADD